MKDRCPVVMTGSREVRQVTVKIEVDSHSDITLDHQLASFRLDPSGH